MKNVGNIVPPAGVTGTTNSTAAAIEFAVATLEVSDIVVCGHSQCGAMQALLEGLPQPAEMPHLAEWLQVARPVQELIARGYQHLQAEARVNLAAEENVLFAIENLKTYPVVQTRLANGLLHLHGWFFEIATAELFAFHPETKQFEPFVRPGQTPA